MTTKCLWSVIIILSLLLAINTFAYGADAARYHFDEGSGQTVADSSGNGNNGTLGSSTSSETEDPAWGTSGEAKFGDSCIICTRSQNDWVRVPDDNSLDFSGNTVVHLEAWIYPTLIGASADYTTQYIIWKGAADGSTANYFLNLGTTDTGNNYIRFGLIDSGGALRTATKTYAFTTTTWHFVSATFDPSKPDNQCVINVDGTDYYRPLDMGTNTMVSNSDDLCIGRRGASTPSNAFQGRIDEVVISSVWAPTSVDVSDLRLSRHGAAAVLSWRIPSILDIFGFNIFRSDTQGKWVRVNRETIPAPWNGGRMEYQLAESDGLRPSYRLQAVGLDGRLRWIPMDVE